MNRHASTRAPWWSMADRHLLACLGVIFSFAACSGTQAMRRPEILSGEEAWVASACTPAHPDFSEWGRRLVGGVSVATPPGYIVLQGPRDNIAFRGPARRSSIGFTLVRDEKQVFDSYYYRQAQKRNACRDVIGGYPADVVGWYDRGQYGLIARWEASWGGEDDGKWLLAVISSTRLEEATELRAVLHSIRPLGTHR